MRKLRVLGLGFRVRNLRIWGYLIGVLIIMSKRTADTTWHKKLEPRIGIMDDKPSGTAQTTHCRRGVSSWLDVKTPRLSSKWPQGLWFAVFQLSIVTVLLGHHPDMVCSSDSYYPELFLKGQNPKH